MAEDERYSFRWSAQTDLIRAIELLGAFPNTNGRPVRIRYALLEYALIIYVRPFKATNTNIRLMKLPRQNSAYAFRSLWFQSN